jgi:hypothetical protein
MNWKNNFEQFLRQLSDLQIGLFNNLTSTLPRRESSNPLNFRDTFDKTLKVQEEAVTSSLEFQALLLRLSVENQKQFWEGYFNVLRRP